MTPHRAATAPAQAPTDQVGCIEAKLLEAGRDEAIGLVRASAARRAREGRPAYGMGHELLPSDAAAAEIAFRVAIAAEPGLAPAHAGLSEALWRQGKQDEALGALREAVRLLPESPALRARLGHLLIAAAGDAKEAESAFRAALAVGPDREDLHRGLCESLWRQGRRAEAVHAAREASRLLPNAAHVHEQLGHFLMAMGDDTEAEAAFRAALECDAHLGRAHLALSELLRRQRRLKEAVAAFRRAEALEVDRASLNVHRYLLFGEIDPS